ncbi:ATP-dependent DNA helicase RecG [gut metagenome]|uniref:ATP-dependent DNA helicase RecG n=1 Tax=gut metagenome TaxID=749906 RepID=J9GYK9_9ZZZZ
MLDLDKRAITYLPGVGPKRAEILKKEAGISSYEDLLYYFPYKYIDRSRFYKISELTQGMPYIQLKGRILYFDTLGEGRSRRMIAKFTDGTGTIDLVWFKGLNFVKDKYATNKEYIVFGKPVEFGHFLNIAHPDIDLPEQAAQVANGLTPYYNTSEKMKRSFLNSRAIQNLQYTLLNSIGWELPETLSADLLSRIKMMPFGEAMRNIHFPESAAKLRDAKLRLKFDELFYIQLNILRSASIRKRKLRGILFPTVGHYFNTFYKEHLPFDLTNAQKRVVREIRADMGSGRQMNRLLQGDVGSGKTLVGLLSMLLALDNGCQACMMAPTEILATQHYATILSFLEGMDVKVALLTGSTRKKERDRILPAIASGEDTDNNRYACAD